MMSEPRDAPTGVFIGFVENIKYIMIMWCDPVGLRLMIWLSINVSFGLFVPSIDGWTYIFRCPIISSKLKDMQFAVIMRKTPGKWIHEWDSQRALSKTFHLFIWLKKDQSINLFLILGSFVSFLDWNQTRVLVFSEKWKERFIQIAAD